MDPVLKAELFALPETLVMEPLGPVLLFQVAGLVQVAAQHPNISEEMLEAALTFLAALQRTLGAAPAVSAMLHDIQQHLLVPTTPRQRLDVGPSGEGPNEVRAWIDAITEQGEIVAALYRVPGPEGNIAVQVAGPPSEEIVDVLATALKALRRAVRQHAKDGGARR